MGGGGDARDRSHGHSGVTEPFLSSTEVVLHHSVDARNAAELLTQSGWLHVI